MWQLWFRDIISTNKGVRSVRYSSSFDFCFFSFFLFLVLLLRVPFSVLFLPEVFGCWVSLFSVTFEIFFSFNYCLFISLFFVHSSSTFFPLACHPFLNMYIMRLLLFPLFFIITETSAWLNGVDTLSQSQ